MHQGVLTLQCGQGVDTAVNVKLMKTCHGSYSKNPKKRLLAYFKVSKKDIQVLKSFIMGLLIDFNY